MTPPLNGNDTPPLNLEPEGTSKELLSGEQEIAALLQTGAQRLGLMGLTGESLIVSAIVHVGLCLLRAIYDSKEAKSDTKGFILTR